jgi:hypothetical protein
VKSYVYSKSQMPASARRWIAILCLLALALVAATPYSALLLAALVPLWLFFAVEFTLSFPTGALIVREKRSPVLGVVAPRPPPVL